MSLFVAYSSYSYAHERKRKLGNLWGRSHGQVVTTIILSTPVQKYLLEAAL